MLTLETFKKKLSTKKKIVVTTHFKPDGDAMGSSLALYYWLKGQGHDVHIIVPSDYPAFLAWMPGHETSIIYTKQTEVSNQLISDADFIFCLDFNHLSRIHEMESAVRKSEALKVMIDHHLEPEGFDDFRHWNPKAAATAQLVYDFIVRQWDDRASITPEMATCMYTGIMTDTGSFRFSSTSAEVHLTVADLITLGADNSKIHQEVFNNSSEKRLRFLGYCLLNCLVVIPEYNVAYFAVSHADIQRFNVSTGDTEGLVNYALSITGIRLAALIIDRKEMIKISLRSVGNVPCNEICTAHFNGGGHKNASGGSSNNDLESTVAYFKSILPMYKEILTQE